MPVVLTVAGQDQTAADLRGLAGDLDDLEQLYERTARAIATNARARAPRRTGDLAAAITVAPGRHGISARVADSHPYAGVIHYGGYNNITAQPFMTEAAAEELPRLYAAVHREINSLTRHRNL